MSKAPQVSRHSHLPAVRGRLGFNGEYQERSGLQILGSYRAYNPYLMRFHSPDNLSPLRQGGLNPYAYCLGDPVNLIDPTGHLPWWVWRILTPTHIAILPAAVAVGTLAGSLATSQDEAKGPLMRLAVVFGGLAGATVAAPLILKTLSRSRYRALQGRWREQARLPPSSRASATQATSNRQRRNSTPSAENLDDRLPDYAEALQRPAPLPLPDELPPPPYPGYLDPPPPYHAPFLPPGSFASLQPLAARAADIRRG